MPVADCGWLAAGCDDSDTAVRIRVLAEKTNDVLVVEHAHVASGQRSYFVKIVFGNDAWNVGNSAEFMSLPWDAQGG